MDCDEALTKNNVCAGGYRQPTNGKHLTFCDAVAPFPMKEVREMSAEISYGCHIITQIWIVL